MPTVSLARGSPVLFYAVPSRSGVFSLFNGLLRVRIEFIVSPRVYFLPFLFLVSCLVSLEHRVLLCISLASFFNAK